MPNLDLNIVDTHNRRTFGIGDNSSYSTTPSNATLEITPPGFPKKNISFTPGELKIINSNTVGITNSSVDTAILPDGLWKLKYSIHPNYKNFINISFYKTDLLEEKYHAAFLSLDFSDCSEQNCHSEEELDKAYMYLQGAKANASVCNYRLANKLYKKSNKILSSILGDSNNC